VWQVKEIAQLDVTRPDRTDPCRFIRQVALLIRFLAQNGRKFSKRAVEKEFKALSATERRNLETLFAEIFISGS